MADRLAFAAAGPFIWNGLSALGLDDFPPMNHLGDSPGDFPPVIFPSNFPPVISPSDFPPVISEQGSEKS